MKYALIALAASSMFGGAIAGRHSHHRRHDHPAAEECVAPLVPRPCETIVKSYLVEAGHTGPVPSVIRTEVEASTTIPTPIGGKVTHVTDVPHGPAEPEVTICPTPGTYTFPPETVTLTQTEYICVPTTTQLQPGTHTIGGVTTIVDRQTTIVCPVPDVQTVDDVVVSKVTLTTYVCPTPGTYTINPITTTITEVVDCEYPEISTYEPGTYTRPEAVITVTETQVVVTCPYLETVVQEVTVVPVEPTSPPEAKPTEVEEKPKETSEAPAPINTSTPVPPHSRPLWAITYSPFVKSGGQILCKDAAQVGTELADIANKGFSSIRVYSPECNALKIIAPAAEKNGLKLVLGIFIKDSSFSSASAELAEIIAWKRWDMVELMVIGNEALFQGFTDGGSLAGYINSCRDQLRAAGYNGPVTTTEPLNILQANAGTICGASDVVGVNIHPYFNPNVKAEDAGDFVNGQIAEAKKACGGKAIYVLEAGWPNAGNVNGVAVPSPDQQKIAFGKIKEVCPLDKIVVFTYENDYWKQPGAFNVEQNFGVKEIF